MEERKSTDIKQFTPLSKRMLYGRVFFWVFFIILTVEIAILSASYLIYYKPGMTIKEEAALLIGLGCVISTITAVSIIWAIQLMLTIYERHSPIKSQQEFDLLSDLDNAIKNFELSLYFQPQFNLQNGKLVGMETLLRWEHPTRGVIMPDDFIPLAEKAGLIEAIGEWTLLQSCIHTKKLLDQGFKLRVAVNVSPLQFLNPLFVQSISTILTVTQLPPQNLELEITETAMIQNIDYAISAMKKLRDLGILLSVDDFGTGYSSLTNIDRFPIHKLKIDKAFVKGINPDEIGSNLAYSIIQMAHKLNLQILVEGIENEFQKNYFTKLKCHEGQGYYFGTPIPAKHFANYLTDLARNLRP